MSSVPVSITRKVDARDEERCSWCGTSLSVLPGSRHHRLRRRDGGHSVSILILLCGSGTTGCHGRAHSRVRWARANGLIIPAVSRIAAADVPEIPVRTRRGWELHPDEGGFELILEAAALERLDAYGLLRQVA